MATDTKPVAEEPAEPDQPLFRDLVKQALKKFSGALVVYDGAPAVAGKVALPFQRFTSEIQLLVAETGLCTLDDGRVVPIREPLDEVAEKHPSAMLHVDAPPASKGVPLAEALKK